LKKNQLPDCAHEIGGGNKQHTINMLVSGFSPLSTVAPLSLVSQNRGAVPYSTVP
jgi:hypothetical protein